MDWIPTANGGYQLVGVYLRIIDLLITGISTGRIIMRNGYLSIDERIGHSADDPIGARLNGRIIGRPNGAPLQVFAISPPPTGFSDFYHLIAPAGFTTAPVS